MINSFKEKLTREKLLENLPATIVIALLGFVFQWVMIAVGGTFDIESLVKLLWFPLVVAFYMVLVYLPALKNIWNVICGHVSKVKRFFKMVCGHFKK
ncbi:hypothetical protein [Peribacillus sp. TH24]|uniref:hypothetical protein n=1 Tax=Peribacillus TaxID=2675229 RepID=UPI001913CDFD|nr:hypothetical protein [Peribacillus sp. TH24]MBK5447085.1 hypothetical protein [Peribacillus sp. TH24]MBK5447098.1 hypothetical protein [Peribacillus sp. TH24]